MPHLNSNFTGNRYWKQRHAETIFPALFRSIQIDYTRQQLNLPDGDFLDLDWVKQSSSKLLVLFHGLEGSSQSGYIKGFAQSFSNLGWDVCAVNYRSCSGRMNNLKRSYHSGATDDVHAIIQAIYKPYQQIVLGGFSLGGNMLLKYLGEQVYPIPANISAAFAFSVPCDLRASALEMAKWHNTLYMQRFMRSMVAKMKHKANQFPDFLSIEGIDRLKTFHEFDNRYNAPLHGFKNADDYYAQCSSLQFLKSISIPTLLVNALNDPFLTPSCFPVELAIQNPNLYIETPAYGGHVGFAYGWPNQNYWSENRAYEFCSQLGL